MQTELVEKYVPESRERPVENPLAMRATIEEIVRHHDRAMVLYAEAWDAIKVASDKVAAAQKEASLASPGVNSYNHEQADEVKRFRRAVALPDRDEYLRTARRLSSVDVWAWVVEHTDLERLMDKEAKDKLRHQMRYIPETPKHERRGREVIDQDEVDKGMPPVTVENITATLDQFMLDAGSIFRRGIANAFSKLDRRFRSHDGFKIGSRVILTRAFNDSGRWNYSNNERDTLIDIERTFTILDGVSVKAAYATTIGAVDATRGHRYDPHQSVTETPYFRIRIFQNGNAHLWMLRDDLVEKVNKLLAEHYGEVVGDGQTREADPLNDPKTTPAKYYGFYPTQPDVASKLLEYAGTLRRKDEPALRVLEPSAGTGNIARLCVRRPMPVRGHEWERKRATDHNAEFRFDNKVDCVELQPHLAEALKAERIYNRVVCGDFLKQTPDPADLYDLVVMNPPFDRERDVDHVAHAMKFLKPDGRLYAIMSAGTEFRETKKSVAFRKLVIEQKRGSFTDLPAGSFSAVGTNVNTLVLRMHNDGSRASRW